MLFGDKDGLLRELFRIVAETMRRHHEAVPVGALGKSAGSARAATGPASEGRRPHLTSASGDAVAAASLGWDLDRIHL